jgi:plasmid stabilization system protein ParE
VGEIYWSLNAQKNLEAIADYIAKDSPYYAVNFVSRIMRYAETLSDLPELGRMVPEFNDRSIRELIFHNYRIVYKLQGEEVFIVAVTHGSVDITRKSKKERWEIS